MFFRRCVLTCLILPHVTLDLAAYDPKHRMDAWREYNRGLFEIKPNPESIYDHMAKVETYKLQKCLLGRVAHSGSIISESQRALFNNEEFVVLRIHRKGKIFGTFGENYFEMDKSSITIFDYQVPIRAEATPLDYMTMIIPYSALGYDPSRHDGLIQFSASSPIAQILSLSLSRIIDLLPTSSPSEINRSADAIVDIVGRILVEEIRDERAYASHGSAVEAKTLRFIHSQLNNPNLNTESICREIGVSRAVLYRTLKSRGGVRRALYSFRMKAAYKEITHTQPARGVIAKIARKWCFNDHAHFTRLFKEHFHCRPSDVMGLELQRAEGAEKSSVNFSFPSMQSFFEDAQVD